METTTQTTLPPLTKGSATYKLVVPEKVEEKIRYLLRKFPRTEWSGVLFTTHTGSFEKEDLVITCEDIYPMDLGDATFTQFTMSEDVAAYMAENIELFDCDLQLCHSHHVMQTTPSGTDIQTLREEGNERNCFVSLIVNNAGTYYAAITRKVQTKSEVTAKSLGKSYEFFGEGSKELTHEGTEVTKVIEKEVIEYFDLEVERHEVQNNLSYLDDRFDEIARRKQLHASEDRMMLSPERQSVSEDKSFLDYLHGKTANNHSNKELDLFGEQSTKCSALTKADEEKLGDVTEWQPDKRLISDAAKRILTCSPLLPANTDIQQWVKTCMVPEYEKAFGKYGISHYIGAFDEWRDFIIQFTLDYYDDPTAPRFIEEEDRNKIIYALCAELGKYRNDDNPYIQEYINALELNLS